MKRSLFLALVLALPFSQRVRADDNRPNRNRARTVPVQTPPAQVAAARQGNTRTVPQPSVQRPNLAYPPHRLSTATRVVPPRSVTTHTVAPRSVYTNRNHHRPVVNRTTTITSHRFDANNGRFRDRSRENNAPANSPVAVQPNPTHPKRHVDRNSYNHARQRWVRTWHNRNWWRSHRNVTFVLFGGGYYYLDDGYWFPAYGYDPSYNNYIYSEPIYAYQDLAPGQILKNVQIALRDQGYYPGAIDGLIGIQTRAALRAFQRDHGLIVTEAVDQPTLVALGLT